MNYPVQKDPIHPVRVSDKKLILFSGFYKNMVIESPLLIHILEGLIPLIDGRTSIEELQEEMKESLSPDSLDDILQLLIKKDLVEMKENSLPPQLAPDIGIEVEKESVGFLGGKRFLIYCTDNTSLWLARMIGEVPETSVNLILDGEEDENKLKKIKNLFNIKKEEKIRDKNSIKFYSLCSPEPFINIPSPHMVIFPPENLNPRLWLEFREFGSGIPFLFSLCYTGRERMILFPSEDFPLSFCDGDHSSLFEHFSMPHPRIINLSPPLLSHFLYRWFSHMEYRYDNLAVIKKIFQGSRGLDMADRDYNPITFAKEIISVINKFFYEKEEHKKTIPDGVERLNVYSPDMKSCETHYFTPPPEEKRTGGKKESRGDKSLLTDKMRDDIISSPLTGIIGKLETQEPPSPQIPFYLTNARLCHTEFLLGQSSYRNSAGCSHDRNSSRWSAVGEALERYCSAVSSEREFYIQTKKGQKNKLYSYNNLIKNLKDNHVILGFMDSFCPHPHPDQEGGSKDIKKNIDIIDPYHYSLYSKNQYKEKNFPFKPFTQSSKIKWTVSGYIKNLTSLKEKNNNLPDDGGGSLVLIPSVKVNLPYTLTEGEREICPSVSIGLGCGRTVHQALLTGLQEVLERHRLAVMWLRKDIPHQINLSFIKEILKEKNLSHFIDPSLQYYIWDLTAEDGIPVILTIGFEKYLNTPLMSVGSACRLDPVEAVIKSLTEMSHNRIFIRNRMNDFKNMDYLRSSAGIQSFAHHLLYYNINPQAIFQFGGFLFKGEEKNGFVLSSPMKENSSFTTDKQIKYILEILGKQNIHPLYSILTTDDVKLGGYEVVRVVIPQYIYPSAIAGMEFLGCPHLYKTGLSEENLNHYPHPFP